MANNESKIEPELEEPKPPEILGKAEKVVQDFQLALRLVFVSLTLGIYYATRHDAWSKTQLLQSKGRLLPVQSSILAMSVLLAVLWKAVVPALLSSTPLRSLLSQDGFKYVTTTENWAISFACIYASYQIGLYVPTWILRRKTTARGIEPSVMICLTLCGVTGLIMAVACFLLFFSPGFLLYLTQFALPLSSIYAAVLAGRRFGEQVAKVLDPWSFFSWLYTTLFCPMLFATSVILVAGLLFGLRELSSGLEDRARSSFLFGEMESSALLANQMSCSNPERGSVTIYCGLAVRSPSADALLSGPISISLIGLYNGPISLAERGSVKLLAPSLSGDGAMLAAMSTTLFVFGLNKTKVCSAYQARFAEIGDDSVEVEIHFDAAFSLDRSPLEYGHAPSIRQIKPIHSHVNRLGLMGLCIDRPADPVPQRK